MNTMLRTKALILVLSLASAVAAAAPPPAPPATQPAARVARAPVSEVLDRAAGAFMFIGGGSGVAIDPDGYVITNAHVVQGSKRWRMRSGAGKAYTADVVGRATMTDLALLKIRGEDLPPHLPLGDSDALHPGEPVVAVGNPFGLGNVDGVPAVSLGSVSALGVDRPRAWDCVVTDAAINPGNSGGPLMTTDGRVVGINGQVATRFGVRANTGIGFAISSNQIRRYLPALREAAGAEVAPGALAGATLDYDRAGEARVDKVADGSAAQKAGLRPGDVVRRIGQWDVRDSGHLTALVGRFPAGADVELAVSRDGQTRRLRMTLGAPVPGAVGVVFHRGNQSLRIDRVVPGGPADHAGIQPGDVIRGISGFRIRRRSEFQAILSNAHAGETVHLTLAREGKDIPVAVRLAPAAEIQKLLDAADKEG